MKSCWFILAYLGLAGCMASNGLEYEAVSETNLYHIARIRKGMNQRQVLFIMHKPYRYETFEVGEDIYDVWFYVTRMTALDQTRMVPQNLTPLTFKNGILVGTGYSWYYFAMKEEARELEAQSPAPPRPKTQQEEDTEFEKALRSPSQPMPPVPQPPSASIMHGQGPAPTVVTEEAQPAEIAVAPQPPVSFLKPWSPPTLGAIQRAQLKSVSEGMTEAEVTHLLGTPSHYESFELNQDVYDVWFYEIAPAKKKQQAEELPLTFKNGVLVSLSWDYYNNIKNTSCEDGNCYDREAERMQQQESDQNFNFW